MILPIILGGNTLTYLLGKKGYFEPIVIDYLLLNGIMIVGFIVGDVLMKRFNKKREGMPMADERTLERLKNYLLGVIVIIFLISGVSLFVLFLMDVEAIDVGWLFVYLAVLLIGSIGGGLVVSRR